VTVANMAVVGKSLGRVRADISATDHVPDAGKMVTGGVLVRRPSVMVLAILQIRRRARLFTSEDMRSDVRARRVLRTNYVPLRVWVPGFKIRLPAALAGGYADFFCQWRFV
jgi:hypothetical protein